MIVKFYYAKPKDGVKKILSKVMQIGENVDFGHFAMGLDHMVYEAVLPRCRKMLFKEWEHHYEVVREVQWTVPPHLEKQVTTWLEGTLRIPYGLDQILLLTLTLLFKPLDFLFNKAVINNSKAMICTEVGSRFAERFMGFKPRESHDKIGLADMVNIGDILEENPHWALE